SGSRRRVLAADEEHGAHPDAFAPFVVTSCELQRLALVENSVQAGVAVAQRLAAMGAEILDQTLELAIRIEHVRRIEVGTVHAEMGPQLLGGVVAQRVAPVPCLALPAQDGRAAAGGLEGQVEMLVL